MFNRTCKGAYTLTAKVDIYTKEHCVYSLRAKKLLLIKEVDFVEHNITDAPQLIKENKARQKKHYVPEIFIDDVLIGGCDELFELDERGELDRLLGVTVSNGGSLPSV
jgi:glutaredoxin 3